MPLGLKQLERRAMLNRLCPGCGYDLAGLDRYASCPECGMAADTRAIRRDESARSVVFITNLALLTNAIALAPVPPAIMNIAAARFVLGLGANTHVDKGLYPALDWSATAIFVLMLPMLGVWLASFFIAPAALVIRLRARVPTAWWLWPMLACGPILTPAIWIGSVSFMTIPD